MRKENGSWWDVYKGGNRDGRVQIFMCMCMYMYMFMYMYIYLWAIGTEEYRFSPRIAVGGIGWHTKGWHLRGPVDPDLLVIGVRGRKLNSTCAKRPRVCVICLIHGGRLRNVNSFGLVQRFLQHQSLEIYLTCVLICVVICVLACPGAWN